jgi:hypothetical protein
MLMLLSSNFNYYGGLLQALGVKSYNHIIDKQDIKKNVCCLNVPVNDADKHIMMNTGGTPNLLNMTTPTKATR